MVVANGCWGECAAVAARSDESLSFVVTVQLTGLEKMDQSGKDDLLVRRSTYGRIRSRERWIYE